MSSETPAHEQSWRKLVKDLERQSNCTFILMQQPFDDDEPPEPAAIDKDYLLSIKHVFLPKTVGTTAWKICAAVDHLRINWMYGNTSLGNAIWDNHMIPNLEKAKKIISENKWRKALAILLGIQLAAGSDDGWILDQEIYCEFAIFSDWFEDYSKAWKAILAKTDEQLGFNCNLKPEGYRGVIEDLIRNWENETNEILEETFDEFAEDDTLPRVRIFTESDGTEEDENSDNEDKEN